MQMYVGIGTLITVHVVRNLLAQNRPPGVSRDCTICRTEVVINTQRNPISVERDMKYHSPKTSI